MANYFSEELQHLLNPLPKFADPEDDGDEATKAKVSDTFIEDELLDEAAVGLSALRRRNTITLAETDGRYSGKAVSRKQLLMDMEEEDDDDDDDDDDNEEEEEEDFDEDDKSSIEELEEEDDEEEEQEDDEEEKENEERSDGPDVTFPQEVDFHKLTGGMEDLGVSEEDDSEEELDEDEDDDDEEEEEADNEDEVAIATFSKEKVSEEVEKGKAVRNQLALWDQLLEGRIKIQKVLVSANQLPQPETFPEFKRRGGTELAGAVKNTHKALKALQRSLLELHDKLLEQNSDTRTGLLGDDCDDDDDDEKGRPAKRKLDMADYPQLAAKRFAAFQPYRNATLQKWHDKTRLSTGKSGSFAAFERNIVTQVEHVLMDNERLVRRTQTRRSEYHVLGKRDSSATVTPQGAEAASLKANPHLKDVNEDIFDDDDFYHQLLRELIERKTSTVDPNNQVAAGRQWLQIQKLRSKMKKKVDTKASKGRKVRFHVHAKLLNFMAPMDHSSMNDEARSELYRGLFGGNALARQ